MQDRQTWLDEAKTVQARALRSNLPEEINKALNKPCKVGTVPTLLDYLDSEIKPLPTPCTHAQTDEVIDQMRKDLKRTFPEDVCESLAQIGVLCKQPQVGGRRGAKVAPMLSLSNSTTPKYRYFGVRAPRPSPMARARLANTSFRQKNGDCRPLASRSARAGSAGWASLVAPALSWAASGLRS